MTIKSILHLAALFLGENRLLNSGVFNDNVSVEKISAVVASDRDLQLLIKCANSVIKEISCFEPLSFSEKVYTESGKIPLSSLSKCLREVSDITCNDLPADFSLCCDHIMTVPGNITVTYHYVPEDKSFDESAELSPRITDRLVACGVAAEYSLIKGRYDDAAMWDKRYKDALAVSPSRRRYKAMPVPEWK